MLNIKRKEFVEKLDEGYQIRIIFNKNVKIQEDDMPEEMLWMSYEKQKYINVYIKVIAMTVVHIQELQHCYHMMN